MQGWIAVLFLLLTVVVVPGEVEAMTTVDQSSPGNCRVVDGEKLPASSGGSALICAAVERAIQNRAPAVRYSAEVKVLSSSRLATTMVVNGKALPEQKFAVMDSELSRATIERFAQSLALEVAKAANR